MYDNPQMYNLSNETSACLNHPLTVHVDRDGTIVEYEENEDDDPMMSGANNLNVTIASDDVDFEQSK